MQNIVLGHIPKNSACLAFGQKFPKIPANGFHSSGTVHNYNGLPHIPIPIGCRPRPNPEMPPPQFVLPPPVKYFNRTTPRMLQCDAEVFLYPLYLRGWRVELIRTRDKNKRPLTPFLTARFVLKDNFAIRKAVREIHELEERERHDISYDVFLTRYAELCLRLQTHSARKFSITQQNETSPYVTLRDVRFAILFEKFVAEHQLLLDQSLHTKTFPHLQISWDKILTWFPYTEADQPSIRKGR